MVLIPSGIALKVRGSPPASDFGVPFIMIGSVCALFAPCKFQENSQVVEWHNAHTTRA
ncbi:MAG: hypothetical protein KGI83_04940 [Verrucomicrobiota bacterium]|nr:hypothetical protein [Verrucomicrobiota bacterium]